MELVEASQVSFGLWIIEQAGTLTEFVISYAGEITLWTGLSIVGFNALRAASTGPSAFLPGYFPYLAFLSPAFTYVLLNYASGVPLLEESAEKKWGDREDWKEYKRKVPVLFGLPGSKI